MSRSSDSPARQAVAEAQHAWRTLMNQGPSRVQFWVLALVIGAASGAAAVGFRLAINWLQGFVYGTDTPELIHSHLPSLPWWLIVLIPTLGGLTVGLLLNRFTEDGRVRSVSDVIQAAALSNGRLQRQRGWASTLASWITLSTGGASGREGPVVHLAGLLATYVSRWIKADGITGRELLGCAVAAAVSASFNAPIAGALFAQEVILRHFAVHAFAPIVIASVAGTVVNRLVFGGLTEFTLPLQSAVSFYQELPAFMLLGALCGVVAVVLMRSVFYAEDLASALSRRVSLHRALRPALAGFLLGIMALWFPHIVGVGYETTFLALSGKLALTTAIVFAIVKVIAVSITLGGYMGGGIFSPSLMIGALTGLAFGLLASAVAPAYSDGPHLYALAGMGAVAASVLGAPISTTLIVFELTGDWQTGIAVMLAVSISVAISAKGVQRSFFLTQLETKGIHLAAGPQAYLLATFKVSSVMRATGHPRAADEDSCWELVRDGSYLDASATLEQAMPLFERTGAAFLPVVALRKDTKETELHGALFQIDALKAYNRALAATAAEEHD